ncbi:hypothetical protein Avbf_02990 [Armadillidium vulgare]|nr:hypothetical protein Avbf_02990 [Armadillidium vulgare]
MLCVEQMIQKECHCSNSINDLLLALQSDLPRCNPTNLTQDLVDNFKLKSQPQTGNFAFVHQPAKVNLYSPYINELRQHEVLQHR